MEKLDTEKLLKISVDLKVELSVIPHFEPKVEVKEMYDQIYEALPELLATYNSWEKFISPKKEDKPEDKSGLG